MLKTAFYSAVILAMLGGSALAADAVSNETAPAAATQAPVAAPAAAPAAPAGNEENTCYSARKCGGKVLNHKDAHNCKNSGGKSWRSGQSGNCTDL